jgi:type II secretory pathway pseudopilin PulG
MNKRQKALLTESIIIIVITAAAAVAMINLKQWVSRTEAIQVMEQLGQVVLQYRKENGSLPSGDDVKDIQEKLQGEVRLDKLQYRAQWIDVDSAPDEILAYTEEKFRASFLSDGYVVLRLDGRVEWMGKEKFQKLLGRQRRLSPQDLQTLQDL